MGQIKPPKWAKIPCQTHRDWEDANRQAREWCDKVNAKFRDDLKASPRELFAVEQPHLKPLPVWVPPVYLLHHRLVDVEGYVSVNSNYSVPDDLIGRHVEVRQTKDQIEIYRGPRLVATHTRLIEPTGRKYSLPEHRHPLGQRPPRSDSAREEKLLLERLPEIAEYLQAVKKRYPERYITPLLQRLLRLVNDYPRPPLLEALQTAAQYGLFHLDRVETMILRKLAREYFQIHPGRPDGDDDD